MLGPRRMSTLAGTLVDGRYELMKRLGDGTFGEVWKARDTKFARVERSVAVKLLKPEHLVIPEAVDRFDREADALAALGHPNVVGVSDRGAWQGGRFIVMEFVAGQTLADWLHEHLRFQRLPDAMAVRDLFDQLLAGVEAAHEVAVPGPIIHRDLKPENAMLQAHGRGTIVVKVLDFGIARLGARSHQSMTGRLMGTPLYMAPEQAIGETRGIGPQSDVFALGVILAQMLTLSPMPDPQVTEPWWCLAMRDDSKVSGALQGHRHDIPELVWAVISTALRRDARDRFLNAGAMREALRAAWEAGPRVGRSTPQNAAAEPKASLAPPLVLAASASASAGLRPPRPWHVLAAAGVVGVALVLGGRHLLFRGTEASLAPSSEPPGVSPSVAGQDASAHQSDTATGPAVVVEARGAPRFTADPLPTSSGMTPPSPKAPPPSPPRPTVTPRASAPPASSPRRPSID